MEHEVRYDLVNYLALFAIIMIRGLQKEWNKTLKRKKLQVTTVHKCMKICLC